jgi:anti-anti-sigma factor
MSCFSTSVEQFDGICFVQIRGELDIATAGELRAVLRRGRGQFLVDCERLDFIDCSGLSALTEVALLHGRVALRRPSSQLRRMIEIVGLEPLFSFSAPHLYATRSEYP